MVAAHVNNLCDFRVNDPGTHIGNLLHFHHVRYVDRLPTQEEPLGLDFGRRYSRRRPNTTRNVRISFGESFRDLTCHWMPTIPVFYRSVAVDPLPRQGRDMDTTRWIESSKQQYDSDSARWSNFGRRERQLLISLLNRIETSTVTSTITSYTLSYSSTTVTNTKLAGIQALSCLPSGYTLCWNSLFFKYFTNYLFWN